MKSLDASLVNFSSYGGSSLNDISVNVRELFFVSNKLEMNVKNFFLVKIEYPKPIVCKLSKKVPNFSLFFFSKDY